MSEILQKAFKEKYLAELKEQISVGVGLDRYTVEGFIYEPDESSIGKLPGVFAPSGLLDEMMQHCSDNGKDDFEAEVTLYNAFENDITPLLASSEIFWA